MLAPLCTALLILLVCRKWLASAGAGAVLVLAVVVLLPWKESYVCSITYGGRETDCPAEVVVQREEATREDCGLANRVLIPANGVSACPERTLVAGRFGWAGYRADGTWAVYIPSQARRWENLRHP